MVWLHAIAKKNFQNIKTGKKYKKGEKIVVRTSKQVAGITPKQTKEYKITKISKRR